MSRKDRKPESLILDPGVLREGPLCEFGSDLGVEIQGGQVVTPWRDRFLSAQSAELAVTNDASEIQTASHHQVAVHIQKSRAATASDLVQAWRILEPGGQLLLAGPNSLGIVSAVKRLAKQLDQTPIVTTNRARSRIVRFKRDDGAGPEAEQTPSFEAEITALDGTHHVQTYETRPGVFSAKKLDAGSELLLEALARFGGHKPPKRIVDLGCGTGVLGISAATIWPDAELLLADGDARAVACSQSNLERCGLSTRAHTLWWDAREQATDTRFDLALVNPPFHQHGNQVDLGPALSLFDSLGSWLGRNGRALIVANRTLPWEEPLARLGEVETLRAERGYKLLSVKRTRRSSGARGRSSPGARSSGKSRAPTRSR